MTIQSIYRIVSIGGRCLVATTLLCVLSICSFAQRTDVRERYNAIYLESVVQREKGAYTAQFELLRHALEVCPDAPEALFDLGVVAARAMVLPEDTIEALFARAVVLTDSMNTDYLDTYARYEVSIGRFGEAIPIFKRLATDPLRRDDAFQMLSAVYERQQDFEALLEVLQEWEKTQGETEELSSMKMKTLHRLERYDEEIAVASRLMALNADNDYYPVARAEAYLQKGDTAMAWASYEDIVAKNPGNLSAQMFPVFYYQTVHNEPRLLKAIENVVSNEEQPEALKKSLMQSLMSNLKGTRAEGLVSALFDKIMMQPLETPELPELYAQYLASKNAPDSAYVLPMTKLLEIEPSNEQARLLLVQDALDRRAYDQVADLCREGIRLNPKRLLFYHIAGGSLYQQRKISEALRVFEAGMAQIAHTRDKEIVSNFLSSYADALHEGAEPERAYAYYDSALVYNPHNVVCLNNYAYFLSLAGERLDEAQQMSSRVLKYEPDNPTYIDTYAWILFVNGRYEEARAYIEQALALVKNEPEDASLYEHAGDIYILLGRKRDAQQAWRKARELGSTSKTLKKKIKTSKYIAE